MVAMTTFPCYLIIAPQRHRQSMPLKISSLKTTDIFIYNIFSFQIIARPITAF